jgi:hypothetical protein
MLDFLRQEKPFPGKLLFIRAGAVNNFAEPALQSFTSDAAGNFELSLPPGDYCVVEESKKDKLKIPDFTKENADLAPRDAYRLTSEQCLREWWQACDRSLKVGKQDLKGVVIHFHHTCRPPCVIGGPKPR